jgi:tetratricopeptide (TPR) repeat protein
MNKAIYVMAYVLLVIILAITGCTTSVSYNKQMPAELEIQDVQSVAVADFDGMPQSGCIIASKVAAGIVDGRHYRLFEREKLGRILEEHDMYGQGVGIDPTTTRQLKLQGVDALVFGIVDAYNISDQRGTNALEKKVGTGQYRRVAFKDPKTGETRYREEEITKTVLWNRPYVLREGTVGVTFRMANTSTGEIVAVEAMTANFSKRAWQDEVTEKLPSKDALLDTLASQVVRRFLNKIQPHSVRAKIDFEKTGDPHNKLGITYAKNGLWDKALAEFERASHGQPHDPSAFYNLSMAYYALGEHAMAAGLVEKAITLDPKNKYISALGMIRRDM